MRHTFLKAVILLCVFAQTAFAQEQNKDVKPERYTAHNKGKFFVAFGGNRGWFSDSDIHFKGNGFDFTVENAQAVDKPKGWHIDYINPTRFTIPQTNMRYGYFINDHYSVAFNIDHMKYVFYQKQTANVSGYVDLPASQSGSIYNGTYDHQPVDFSNGKFLRFEHTNGLNYINAEIARHDDISKIFNIGNTDIIQLNITEGAQFGFLYPRTDATVLDEKRHDDFHVAGYGISAKGGLNLTFLKYFFIQTELKAGYINMPDIEISDDKSQKASQHFTFLETIVSFGGIFRIY